MVTAAIDNLFPNSVIEDYKTFLRFPSISSDTSKKTAINECAKWLYNYLLKSGFKKVKIYPTPLHPIVYAEYIVNPSLKTILFYGHYDVQPTGPLSKWKSPPFNPVIRDNYIYARGASDDKGQLFIQLKAIEYILKNKDQFRVNIKCLYEGEEETGSQHLGHFIRMNHTMLQSDVVVVSDSKMSSINQPAITYSLRGSFNAELVVSNGARELHSGTFGGMVQDPASVLSRIISAMHTEDGRIRIPYFYKTVVQYPGRERLFMQQSGPSNNSLLADSGATVSHGEPGFSNYERTTIRPSIVVTTLQAGHIGEGFNNSIASSAIAKFNVRLANGQDPKQIAGLLRSFIQRSMPRTCSYSIRFSSLVSAAETERINPFMLAAAKAYKKIFQHPASFLRAGGTIPVVSIIQKEMKTPVVLMGFALGSDNMHAPNERFYLPNLSRGISTIVAFTKEVSML